MTRNNRNGEKEKKEKYYCVIPKGVIFYRIVEKQQAK